MKTISVIVPVYNVEAYLRRCIDSILGQTFGDFELILVDDGSPDRCGAICDAYGERDCRIRVIHRENGGVSRARNAALEIARGKYIAFCDSDDYWAPDFLETLYAAAEETDSQMVAVNYTAVDNDGRVLWESRHCAGVDRIHDQQERCRYLIENVMQGKTGWELCTRIFRGDVIRENAIRFCTACGDYAEDIAFLLRYCLYAERFCSLEYNGYFYRIHPQSMVRSSEAIPKVQEKNEVSAYFGGYFFAQVQDPSLRKLYPVIHYLLTCGEYEKLLSRNRWAELPKAIRRVENRVWYESQTRGILRCKDYLEEQFGTAHAHQILILSRFCLHRCWPLFRLERGIYNRVHAHIHKYR